MNCNSSGDVQRDETPMSTEGQEIQPKDSFQYLGSTISKDGKIEEDVELEQRIRAEWLNWRLASRMFCDRRIPPRLKGKYYKTTIRPAMIYGIEY